jgi:hypothetical protein
MRRPTLPLAGLLLCLAALLPPSALATVGSYEVQACNAAPAGANHSWVWSSTDTSTSDHFTRHETCPYPTGSNGGKTDQESGLATTDTLGLSDGAPPNTSAAWTFTAPAGTTIAGITYERYLGHMYDAVNDWVPALRADGTIVPGESCLDTIGDAESCYVGGPPGHGEEPAIITGLSAHQLSYGIDCVAEPDTECITGATQHAAWAAMYGARVTISDPTTPTLTTPTGALWEPATYHKGTQTVTVEAGDTGGGIRSITLSADGKPIETYEAACDYTYAKPCPTSTGTQTLTLPTTQLTDGTHTIALTATDAAGVQTSTSEQITIANEPPPILVSACCSTPETHAQAEPSPPTTTAPGASTPPKPIPLPSAPATSEPKLHATATLRGRRLTVHVRANRDFVTVRYELYEPGHSMVSRTRKVRLYADRAAISFTLIQRVRAPERVSVVVSSSPGIVSIIVRRG